MPGAGSKLNALDAPPSNFDEDSTDESFTNTAYDSGTTVVGVTFVAPTSGTVLVLWSARMNADAAGGVNHRVLCSVKVSTGGTLDAGTVVSGSADDSALETPETGTTGPTVGQSRLSAGMWRHVSGLTAGSTYNVVVQKKVATAFTGNVFYRSITVLPMP